MTDPRTPILHKAFCLKEYQDKMDNAADEFDQECGECGGEGYILADCFEDTCCCADPETSHGMVRCICNPPKKGVD